MSDNNQTTNKAQTRAGEIIARMAEQEKDDALAFINETYAAVTEATPPKRVPEPVFREIFLPFFTGEREASESEDAICSWMGLVGGGGAEAVVCDPAGNVLFTVPPIYDTSLVSLKLSDKGGINGVIREYVDTREQNARLANTVLTNGLAQSLVSSVPEPASTKPSAWEPIFRHYNLLPPAQAEAVKSTTPSDDDYTFE